MTLEEYRLRILKNCYRIRDGAGKWNIAPVVLMKAVNRVYSTIGSNLTCLEDVVFQAYP